MARALRRALSPQIQERHLAGKSSSSGGLSSMPQNGGRSMVISVDKSQYGPHSRHNSTTSSPAVSVGMDFSSGFSSPSPPPSTSHFDKLSSLANLPSIFSSCLRFMGRNGASAERPAKSSRGIFWKKPLLHLLLCLVLGILVGFFSIFWSDMPPARDSPRDLSLMSGFVTNLRREGSQTASQKENGITFDSWRAGASFDEGNDGIAGENLRALRVQEFDSGLPKLAPGLNHTLNPNRKLLIIVTPTYNRAFQAYYLTRLAHALRVVPPPLLWLVVEMPFQTLETASFLRQTGIMYRHLVCRDNVTGAKDRSAHQRNFALQHIEMHQLDGIVYFADDDNIYSHELFEEMRKIRRFGTWLVAMLGESKEKAMLEGPVCDENKVIGWHTNEKIKNLRRFHVDLSGFAFNSTTLWNTTLWRHRSQEPIRQSDTVREGFQGTNLIEQLVEDEAQMEGLPSGCDKVLVWHLRVEAPDLNYPYGWSLATNLFPNIPLQMRM